MALGHEDISKRLLGTVCLTITGAFTMGNFFPSHLLRIAPFLGIAHGAALHGHCMMKFERNPRITPLSANTTILALPADRAIVDCGTELRQRASLGRTTWAGHHQGDLLNLQYE